MALSLELSDKNNMSNKYKIIFDTNVIRCTDDLKRLINSNISDLYDFLCESKIMDDVIICVPEIVIDEIIKGKLEKVQEAEQKFIDLGSKLKFLKCDYNVGFNLEEYEDTIRKELFEIIANYHVEIIPNHSGDIKIIIDRALSKKFPFQNSDRGFKDTIIWLSVLDDVGKNKDVNYIIITDNTSDFDPIDLKEEFSDCSTGELFVCKSPAEIKEQLDYAFDLKLKIKEIKDNISEIGLDDSIIISIISYLNSLSYEYTDLSKNVRIEKIGYIGHKIIDIDKIKKDEYKITIELDVRCTLKESIGNEMHLFTVTGINISNRDIVDGKFNINISYNIKNNKLIGIESIYPEYPIG